MRENDHGQNPTADGYVFHCWVTTLDFEPDEVVMSNTAYYDETPIYEDMTLYAVWYKLVDEVEITAEPPAAGDVVGTKRYETEDWSFNYSWPRPRATVTSEGVRVPDYSWDMDEKCAVWLEDPDDRESNFQGTFEAGREYGIWLELEPIFGYEFAEKISIKFNGELLYQEYHPDYNLCIITAPIRCVEKIRLRGDIDGSGDVMITDVTYLQRHIAGMSIPFTFFDAVFDVDGSGEVNVMDATVMQCYLAEMNVPYVIGEAVG